MSQGPYAYKTVAVTSGTFSSAKRAAHDIQDVVDEHVRHGWELFECSPVPTALIWKWNLLIFRRPSEDSK